MILIGSSSLSTPQIMKQNNNENNEKIDHFIDSSSDNNLFMIN